MSFSGIQIALSSLYAQRQALETTGHNIANANSPGYSRQRTSMSSVGGMTQPAIHARAQLGGSGVAVDRLDRMRNVFLENRGHREHGALASMKAAQVILGRVELAVAEPSDSSISAQMADFWAGWDDVGNRPGDAAAKNQLVERAITLTTGINQTVAQLDAVRADAVAQVQALVMETNAIAGRVAELNGTIQTAVASGMSPNDLLDQRDLLVNDLAQRVGATARAGQDGTVDVFVGANALVRGRNTEAITTSGFGPVSVTWERDGYPVKMPGGEVAGLVEAVNVTVPRYRSEIDAVAENLKDWVNFEYRQPTAPTTTPTTAPADPGPPEPQFFVRTGDGRLAVNPVLVNDPSTVEAGYAPGTLDGSRAQRIAQVRGPENAYHATVVRLGIEAQTANRRTDIQSAIVHQVDAQREAESGVNLDEEMTNMIGFQHAYSAAARVLNAMDEAIQTLVNLGR